MRDTFNDKIIPATEEDLVYPDESSEFYSSEELKELQALEDTRLFYQRKEKFLRRQKNKKG